MESNDIILDVSVKVIKESIHSGLRNIYVVGSRAYNEGATYSYDVEDRDLVYTSDLELFIDVTLINYFIFFFRNYSSRISSLINNKIELLGYDSHVSLLIKPLNLSYYFDFFRPNSVFLYEFVPVLSPKSIYLRRIYPTNADTLNLIFSSMVDYLIINFNPDNDTSILDKCYTVSKRCLTLLYVVMLFKKYDVKGYKDRMNVAQRKRDEISDILSLNDLEILNVLTNYKITGNYELLTNIDSSFENKENFLIYINKYFMELCCRVLYFGLNNYLRKEDSIHEYDYQKLISLLIEYKKSKELSIITSLNTLIYEFLKFLKYKNIEKFKFSLLSLFHWNININDWVRLNVAYLFLRIKYKKNDLKYKDNTKIVKALWDLINA